ncbi:(deoxy)nucleoside triphosphate pyrophosphohydrolase [Exiguobacterium antarcticum]|uniref:8-oxo-dGTP diphosphatase n=1 Tax=Exiguobacterium antarcticum TaxID=132920 RepID=A0ABT6R121_9BACL|nr:(deoxy)nucleoside triphosphate pyrophosphohydrolase [Exiguobacterium antarcticum]MDI3234637.1 (deoxy)nucleoside triphosphate pyrophosphohydrolase [Exiguobacterium antarcticum]
MSKKTVQVVGAVITNSDHKVLCALRSPVMSLPNLWEFPGGKIEPGECPEESLFREIQEELNCAIQVGDHIETTRYEYEKVIVELTTFQSTIVSGEPQALEHAELRWVPVKQLDSLEWAPADIPAVKKIMKAFSTK